MLWRNSWVHCDDAIWKISIWSYSFLLVKRFELFWLKYPRYWLMSNRSVGNKYKGSCLNECNSISLWRLSDVRLLGGIFPIMTCPFPQSWPSQCWGAQAKLSRLKVNSTEKKRKTAGGEGCALPSMQLSSSLMITREKGEVSADDNCDGAAGKAWFPLRAMWYAWETFKARPGAGVTNTLPILTLGSPGSLWRLSGEEARKVTAWPK